MRCLTMLAMALLWVLGQTDSMINRLGLLSLDQRNKQSNDLTTLNNTQPDSGNSRLSLVRLIKRFVLHARGKIAAVHAINKVNVFTFTEPINKAGH